ncbi:MAG: 4'-phosphopantetheinyl transferase superfamily protein [Acidobacteria bacterium]|nr:4'-phosphopantetheinyl transferase superfamily protein [Acidobacteriota bacterium]
MSGTPLHTHRPDASRTLLAGTCQVDLDLTRPVPPEVESIPLAAGLERAVPRRQMQFRAGRYCAMRALAALDPRFGRSPIDRATTGAPVWPEGVTGSITHTDDYASAAVAWTAHTVSLGIDTERVMSTPQAQDVGSLLASAAELRHCDAAGLSSLEAFTFVFSAKESVFKCLHPLVGRMFEFDDVRVFGVDAAAKAFHVRIVKDLSEAFPSGTLLEGRFAVDRGRVHTGISLGTPWQS